jgi:hypothetical protein
MLCKTLAGKEAWSWTAKQQVGREREKYFLIPGPEIRK